jgi:hypothetical protein
VLKICFDCFLFSFVVKPFGFCKILGSKECLDHQIAYREGRAQILEQDNERGATAVLDAQLRGLIV